MIKRTPLALLAVIATTAAATVALMPISNAADGTGAYAAWTPGTPTTQGSASLTGTVFPAIEYTSIDSSVGVAKSATLTGTTPFGAHFGTSRGQQYLTSGVASGKAEGSLTLTFDESPIPQTWGIALGDVDAEDIRLSATDTNGDPVDVRGWLFEAFNYAGGEDVPTWTQETERILGNGSDTAGASMWITPTTEVASITFTQIKLSGFPQYQLWIAADILTEADVAELAGPDSVCTATDTDLVNGSFEYPAIPAKAFRQLDQRDVPGWQTSASDRKIEIWSTGYAGVVAQDGNQFAELNATQPSELFQVVETVPGETLTWSLLHRARGAAAIGDTMSVNIGAESAEANAVYTFTDALSAGWVRHTGSYTVPEGQTSTRFGFESGATASGSRSIGNFLDDIYFTTTECIPQAVTEGTVIEPEISPSTSPSPSASPSDSATASPSASPSDSATASPSASPSDSATASPSASPSDSATASPSASPSVSPTPSASPAATPTVAPSASPTPVETAKPAKPTTIELVDIPGVTPGSTVTDVVPPKNGSAEVVDGGIIYTPKDSFRGEETISVVVLTPQGETETVAVTVAVGKEQSIITRWTAPKRLKPGMNWFGPGTFMTNANQMAKVSAECSILQRKVSTHPAPTCAVVAGKEGTYIDVKVYEPTGVEVTISAPAKGKYRPLKETYFYRVNP